jgi:hypothetical protein
MIRRSSDHKPQTFTNPYLAVNTLLNSGGYRFTIA